MGNRELRPCVPGYGGRWRARHLGRGGTNHRSAESPRNDARRREGTVPIWYETDIRDVLRSVRVPTLLIAYESPPESADEADYVASLMPDSTLTIVPGDEATGDPAELADQIRDFVGVDRPVDLDSALLTVLFTDSRLHPEAGRAWRSSLERSSSSATTPSCERCSTAGVAWRPTRPATASTRPSTEPARAIRCALEVVQRVRDLGIEIRAGIHTGECELIDGKAGGISVTTGSRAFARRHGHPRS